MKKKTSKAPTEITLVVASDWEALYIGDELKIEGHNLSVSDVFEMLAGITDQFSFDAMTMSDAQQERLVYDEQWPTRLSEVEPD